MSFTEKMQVGTLVLDYLKVVLYPVLVGFLCWLFRERISAAIDAIRALSFKGASVQLAEREELVRYNATVEQTAKATAKSAAHDLPAAQVKTVEALTPFFSLAARLLPLFPKADRLRFISESTGTLPEEFHSALVKLADEAREVRALTARDVIIAPVTPVTGTVQFGGGADTPLTLRDDASRREPPRSDYKM